MDDLTWYHMEFHMENAITFCGNIDLHVMSNANSRGFYTRVYTRDVYLYDTRLIRGRFLYNTRG